MNLNLLQGLGYDQIQPTFIDFLSYTTCCNIFFSGELQPVSAEPWNIYNIHGYLIWLFSKSILKVCKKRSTNPIFIDSLQQLADRNLFWLIFLFTHIPWVVIFDISFTYWMVISCKWRNIQLQSYSAICPQFENLV